MARTLGVDHGTQGIRFCLLEKGSKRFYEIGREEASQSSVLKLLEERGFLDVELIGLTYSMADAIDRITDVRRVDGRGQLATVTGEFVGGGTRLFDEIASSSYPAILIPGLHRGIACLDRRFRMLYSHMAGSDKVALAYHAYLAVNRLLRAPELLVSDISSNTVTIAIKDGRFFGAVDACLGAPGLLHGPLDLERIREVDAGGVSANQAFYRGGVAYLAGVSSEEVLAGRGRSGELGFETLIMAVKMEICGLASLVRPCAIALSGRAGADERLFERLSVELKGLAPVMRLGAYSAALGAAEIARDVLEGRDDFLGIPVS